MSRRSRQTVLQHVLQPIYGGRWEEITKLVEGVWDAGECTPPIDQAQPEQIVALAAKVVATIRSAGKVPSADRTRIRQLLREIPPDDLPRD